MSTAGQSLGTNPVAPHARAASAEIRPGAGDQQHLDPAPREVQLLADLGPGLLADEQVDERDVGLVAAGERDRLLAGARRQAALDPRQLGQA